MPSAILLGSKPGAVVALAMMLQRGWDVRHVVVTEDAGSSWIPAPSLADYARAKGIDVIDRQDKVPPGEAVDFVISYMYRNLVKQAMLIRARRAALNFHAGPLPEYGGWAFYNVAILDDSPEYGCTCHYMDDDFDTGPLLKVRRFPIIASQETAFSLERKTQVEMIGLFGEFCKLAESGEGMPRQPQDKSRMRYMTQEKFKALKEIPSGADEGTVDRYARAFWYPPYDCAHMNVNGVRVEILPKIAKVQLATALHKDDLDTLYRSAGLDANHGY